MNVRVLTALGVVCVALGVLLPLWQLVVVGIALLSLLGRWFAAFCIGLLVDVAWGVPLGLMHAVYVPFTLTAVLAALARAVARRYVIDRNLPERL